MIELRKITFENQEEVESLSVEENQKNFVAPNLSSLADAWVGITNGQPTNAYAIYNDETMVGFLMYCYTPDSSVLPPTDTPIYQFPHYFMWRLMIDKRYQGKGFGKQAVLLMIDEIKTEPFGPADHIYTSIEPTNENAKKLYNSLGFQLTGDIDDDELVMDLKLHY